MSTDAVWVIEDYEFRRCHTPAAEFRLPVALHGHTYHSQEPVGRMNQIMHKPVLRRVQAYLERRFMANTDEEFDYSDFFYRPPISPAEVWDLEMSAVRKLGFEDLLLALTDHDKIDACLEFHRLFPDRRANSTISQELSIYFEEQVIHLGIHGLPRDGAEEMHQTLQRLAAKLRHDELFELLDACNALVIFNHPLWEFKGYGDYDSAFRKFIRRYRWAIHAFEFNGLRSRRENERTIALARRYQMPLIGGGDRHVGIASLVLAGTREAETYEDFIEEVKSGYASVICKDDYFIPLPWKLFIRTIQYIKSYRTIAYYKNKPISNYPVPDRMISDLIADGARFISDSLERFGWLR